MRNFILSLLVAASGSSFAQYVSLDPTFGTNGVASIDMNPTNNFVVNAFTGCMQQDGKLVVAGAVFTNNTLRDDFALTRFNDDGTVDTGFGNAGRVVFDFLQRENKIVDLLQLPDGRLAALAHTYINNVSDITVAVLHPDGSLDTSVGFNGIRFLGTSYYDEPTSFKLLADGKIMISSMTFGAELTQMFTLYKLNADFTLDTTFGTSGLRHYTEFGNIGGQVEITEAADGNLLVTPSNLDFDTTTGWDIILAKLLPDGNFNTEFGDQGQVRFDMTGIPNQTDSASIIEEQADGKIFIVTRTVTPPSLSTSIAACRLNADGTFDETFGNAGKRSYENAAITYAFPTSLILEPDGKYTIAGVTDGGSTTATFLFLNADGSPDTAYGETGYSNLTGLGVIFRLNRLADGKLVGMGRHNLMSEMPFAAFRFIPQPNLGLADNSVDEAVVYPNPVTSVLSIKTNGISDAKVAVYDLYGRQLSLPSSSGANEISVSGFENLPKGNYLLTLESDNGKRSWKIVH